MSFLVIPRSPKVGKKVEKIGLGSFILISSCFQLLTRWEGLHQMQTWWGRCDSVVSHWQWNNCKKTKNKTNKQTNKQTKQTKNQTNKKQTNRTKQTNKQLNFWKKQTTLSFNVGRHCMNQKDPTFPYYVFSYHSNSFIS